jgi:DNA-binding NarL/FixJ family response regulator/tetratricopeptide (TPR) repeat protein
VVRIASPTFVGRAAELTALDEALDSAAQGHTTTVLIDGDAGVGKTRLLQTWNERARERGAQIAAGACLDLGETGPAYVAIVEALRELLGGLDPAEEEKLVGADRNVLGRVVPELDFSADHATAGQLVPQLAQTRLFERVVKILERAAIHVPVVLEVEDIHWADASSRAFLLYLVEVSRQANLLLIATYRPDEAETDQAIRSTLAQLMRRPRVATLTIPPFVRDELRDQLKGILGAAPSTAVLSAIHARSEGNALFAEELAAAHDPGVDLPASVAAATATKVATLSDRARSVLRAAAVVGRTASYDVLRSVTSFEEVELTDALRESVQARLLEHVDAGESYRFRHALLQEAIYGETLPGERRRLHAAVAHSLAGVADQPPEDADLTPRLAHHWYAAHEFDRAFRASGAAAAAADRQAAYAEALGHYDRLLELWDRATVARGEMTRAGIHERAAKSAFLAGDLPASAIHGRQAVIELENTPDSSLQIRVFDQLASTLVRIGEDPAEASRPLAAMEADGRPALEQVLILIHRAYLLREGGQYREALGVARLLVEIARSENDLTLQARATMLMADLVYIQDIDESLRMFDLARELAARSGDVNLEGRVDESVCEVLLFGRRYEHLLAAAHAALEFDGRAGLGRLARPILRYFQASAHLRLGDLNEGLEAVKLALLDEPTGHPRAVLQLVAAQASIACGSFDDAAAYLEASRLPGATPYEELGRGYLATARAELALARRRLGDVRQIVDATARRIAGADTFTDMSETTWWLAEVGLAAEAERAERARAAQDDHELGEVRAVAAFLAGLVDHVRGHRDGAGIPDIGTTHGYEVLIAGHLARIEARDDPALWVTAAAEFPPSSVEALTARYRQAEAMLAAKARKDEIVAVMAPAHSRAVEIGARPLAGRFEALARRARIDLGVATPAVLGAEVVVEPEEPEGPGTVALRGRGLSDREIDVLTLVAAGFSNHDIGTRLFISDKTASVHVSHILAKLDAASRTEAATIGVRLGLPDVERDERPS